MISERSLASSFPGFWGELLPLLTPAFVRLFNEAYRTSLKDYTGEPLNPIPIGTDIRHHDLVAELGFHLARLSHDTGNKLERLVQDEQMRVIAYEATIELIKSYEGSRKYANFQLNDAEWDEAILLAEQYINLLAMYTEEEVIEYWPVIPGAGFLSSCRADLSVGNILFEVKTVNRNIAGKDLRQLLVYLALQSATGERRWEEAGFFNPRRRLVYLFPIDHLIFRISGGRASGEVFQEFIDYLSSRDAQLDIAF